jgi:hypothetical protein
MRPEKFSADEVPPFDMIFEEPDVIFEVEGEAFPAHKRVLAMHSPVFKAELYGTMREHDMERITIGEMQPVVFETLLHFIYTGSLPAMDNDLGRREYANTIWHLLVAADRYAVDTLKSTCEAILCGNIHYRNEGRRRRPNVGAVGVGRLQNSARRRPSAYGGRRRRRTYAEGSRRRLQAVGVG